MSRYSTLFQKFVDMIQKLFDFFSGNDSGKCYGFFEFYLDFVERILGDDFGFLQIIVECFDWGDFSFNSFLLVILMQVGDVVFNLIFGRYISVGVCKILLEIVFVGFEGFLVEFFSVFAEFKVLDDVWFDGHSVLLFLV